jgi:homoserine kinase
MIEIEVPATSANLGPGFDCLGIALSLSNIVRIERAARTSLKGCHPVGGEDNLFCAHSVMHARPANLCPRNLCRIGHTYSTRPGSARARPRGGGSGGALFSIKGQTRGQRLNTPVSAQSGGIGLSPGDRDIERTSGQCGSAIYGGFTAAALAGQEIIVSHSSVPEPGFLRAASRTLISQQQCGAQGPASYILSYRRSYIRFTCRAHRWRYRGRSDYAQPRREDRIHEPYRRPLIPDFEYCGDTCRAQNAAAVWISGSGPTILAVFETSVPEKNEKSLESAIAERAQHSWRTVFLHADNLGIRAHKIHEEEL